MASSVSTDNLIVGTVRSNHLFGSRMKVQIPDYQRPYVWNSRKVDELIADFEENFFDEKGSFKQDAPLYYLGTILLYEDGEKFDIIDGQQRITTLLLLNHEWSKNRFLERSSWSLTYRSSISKKHIRENAEMLRSITGKLREQIDSVFEKLVFTIIVTRSEDEAFTFFDSQNNRGVPLGSIDYLKSFHLRALHNELELQEYFAKRWDSDNALGSLKFVVEKVLWRNRNWKGSTDIFETTDRVLSTFAKGTGKPIGNGAVRIYPNAYNVLSDRLIFSNKNGLSLDTVPLDLQVNEEQYPFSIRQPLQSGSGFFLYAVKYNQVYRKLFVEGVNSDLSLLYDTIYRGAISVYFKEFFILAVISFYDKFKGERLLLFAQWIDFLLGYYRIKQKSIVQRTVVKILRDHSRNLLDVIEMAYEPVEVIEFIQEIMRAKEGRDDFYDDKELTGVRGTYRNAVLKYFGKDRTKGFVSLKDRKQWIYND